MFSLALSSGWGEHLRYEALIQHAVSEAQAIALMPTGRMLTLTNLQAFFKHNSSIEALNPPVLLLLERSAEKEACNDYDIRLKRNRMFLKRCVNVSDILPQALDLSNSQRAFMFELLEENLVILQMVDKRFRRLLTDPDLILRDNVLRRQHTFVHKAKSSYLFQLKLLAVIYSKGKSVLTSKTVKVSD